MNYRAEIDGLRALAVLAVIAFHAGVQSFSGGYVGVDVFFVISGYLIAGIILDALSVDKFVFGDFYERRARRIFPALIVVILACLPAAWLWLSPEDMFDFGKSLISIMLFMSNVYFWIQSGYFDQASELRPLLHAWSLSVEEQYYFVFPLVMVLIFRYARNRLIWLLSAAALASLLLAIWGTENKPSASFFLLPTRSWELLTGAVLAVHRQKQQLLRISPPKSQGLSLLGLFMIGFSVTTFDHSTPYPGVPTIAPTVGTALIIQYGRPGTWVGDMLRHKALVGIGLVSYSAYLWHQPLFAFARHRSIAAPEPLLLAVLFVVTFILAFITWRFVEVPFRRRDLYSRRAVIGTSIVAFVGLTAFGVAVIAQAGFPNRFGNYEQIAWLFENGAAPQGCTSASGTSTPAVTCSIGAEGDLAIFGDSHAISIFPALHEISETHSISVTLKAMPGCLPLLGIDVANGTHNPGVCRARAREQYEFARDQKVQAVFLVGRWSSYVGSDRFSLVDETPDLSGDRDPDSAFRSGLRRTITAYRSVGAKVYIVEQVPEQSVDPEKVYRRLLQLGILGTSEATTLIRKISVPIQEHERVQEGRRRVIREIATQLDATLVNFDSVFCDSRVCHLGDASRSFYRDRDHVNEVGSKRLVPELISILTSDSVL